MTAVKNAVGEKTRKRSWRDREIRLSHGRMDVKWGEGWKEQETESGRPIRQTPAYT